MERISTATTAPPYLEVSQGARSPAVTVPLILLAVRLVAMVRVTVMRLVYLALPTAAQTGHAM